MSEPKVGDPIYFEGLVHRIMNLDETGVHFVSEMAHEKESGSRPRFEHGASRNDLRWSEELGAWYLWGRLLSKGRGGVGTDERAIVAELRDRGVLPARTTRRSGSRPAGGEHVNLCCSLFRQGIDWTREIDRLRKGDGLSDPAKAAVADYAERYKKKLAEGYAQPDANDSEGE